MRRLASVLVLVACVLVLTYVLAPAASPAGPSALSARDLAAFDQSVPAQSDINAEVERLRSRLATPPQAPVPSRDPFRFGVKLVPPAARSVAPPPAPPALVEPTESVTPALPRLVALTSQTINGILVRCALLGVGDDMVVAKPGDVVMKLVLQGVTNESADFVDPVSGIIYRIK